MLRIRFWPELRKDSAAFTSMRFAPPRGGVGIAEIGRKQADRRILGKIDLVVERLPKNGSDREGAHHRENRDFIGHMSP